MEQVRIDDSTDLQQAAERFAGAVNQWIDDCLTAYGDAPATDVHDQATYTTAWEPLLRRQPRAEVMDFLQTTRNRILDYFQATDQWHHGYWRRQECHHGTEHFELFLGMLSRLDPDDAETRRQLLDAAEHIGNWVRDIPAWYNWSKHRFYSMWLGTESVGNPEAGDSQAINTPDHLRLINIALLAWRASEAQPYLDLAVDAAEPWVQAIIKSGELPAALDGDGAIYNLDDNAAYRGFAGQAAVAETQLARAENLLASAAPAALLQLWQVTDAGRYRQAAERILDVLAGQLIDPDAGAAVDSIRRYRRLTGDKRYDDRIKTAMTEAQPMAFEHIGLELPERATRSAGIGKRVDAPKWCEDEKSRRHSPALLALVAECSGDDVLAARSLDIGRAYFQLARKVFPDGRNHGCSARTVSAVARGHGRENNAGVVTTVLDPILTRFNLELN